MTKIILKTQKRTFIYDNQINHLYPLESHHSTDFVHRKIAHLNT